MDFCNNCGNKNDLILNTTLDLVLKCPVCINSVEKKADTSRYIISSFDAGIQQDIDKRNLRNMSYDQTNLMINKKCPNCSNKIVRFRRTGNDWKKIYGCPVCNTKFTD